MRPLSRKAEQGLQGLQPARTALGAEIVPRETCANAVAWRSSLWQGPALGGMPMGRKVNVGV